jgi:hypothetical protein
MAEDARGRAAAGGVLVSVGDRPLPRRPGPSGDDRPGDGGSSRRAIPGRGLWAAGAFGVRALTQAAALELRERGIHVALLIVDAGIEPLSGAREGVDTATLADPHQVAEAVRSSASSVRAPPRTSCRSLRWPSAGCRRQESQPWREIQARMAREWAMTVPSASLSAGSFVSPVASRSSSREPLRRNGIGCP